MLKTLLMFAITISTSASAAVFKCDVNGKTVYQQAPCANGKAVDIQESSASAATQRQIDAQQTKNNRAELHEMANEIERRNEATARAQLQMMAAQNRAEHRQHVKQGYVNQYRKRANAFRHDAIVDGAYGQSWGNTLPDD